MACRAEETLSSHGTHLLQTHITIQQSSLPLWVLRSPASPRRLTEEMTNLGCGSSARCSRNTAPLYYASQQSIIDFNDQIPVIQQSFMARLASSGNMVTQSQYHAELDSPLTMKASLDVRPLRVRMNNSITSVMPGQTC